MRSDGYPAIDCTGLADGTSGGPWLTSGATVAPTVVGVVGGLQQGGCSADTSYSAPFGTGITALENRAAADRHPDLLTPATDSGC